MNLLCEFCYTDVCGEGWVQFSSSCYLSGKSDLYSWHGARQFCRENGAELASIHDSEELHFLMTQVQ